MENSIIDKLYIIVEEAKKTEFENAIKFADKLAKRELAEFSYIRSNKVQYCEWQTIREYIYFAREIECLEQDLKSPTTSYSNKKGFSSWVGDSIVDYIDENGFSISLLEKAAMTLINSKKLPTTEFLFSEVKPDVTEKHFRWSLSTLQEIRPLAINVCRKWIWIPAQTFEFE